MYYLLFQPEALNEKDIVYKNGQRLEDYTEYSSTYNQIVTLFEKAGHSSYPWMGKYAGYYVVRGLFNTTDEKGRTLAFLFASDSKDIKEELRTLSGKIDQVVSDSTWQTIEVYLSSSNKRNGVYKIALAIALIILITLIISLCNK